MRERPLVTKRVYIFFIVGFESFAIQIVIRLFTLAEFMPLRITQTVTQYRRFC